MREYHFIGEHIVKSINNTTLKRKHIFFLAYIILNIYYFINFTHHGEPLLYILTQYLPSYDLGFISRGFIGSILSWLHLTEKMHIYLVITLSNQILIILSAWFVTKVIHHVDNSIKSITFCIALYFVTNPGSISFLFTRHNFGRLELFCIIIMLISLFIVYKNNTSVYLLPILFMISILIYHGSIFMYIPIVLVLMLYIAVIRKDMRMLIILIVSCLLSCATFLHMEFYGKITHHSIKETVAFLQSKTDFPVDKAPIKVDYYFPFKQHSDYMDARWPRLWQPSIFAIVTFSPVLIFLYYVFGRAMIKANKNVKLIYLAILLNALTFVPLFYLTVDYGRWCSGFMISQFALLLALIHLKDGPIMESLAKVQSRVPRYCINITIMLYAIMPHFTHYEVFPLYEKWEKLWDTLRYIIEIILT